MRRTVCWLVTFLCFYVAAVQTEVATATESEKNLTSNNNLSSTMEQMATHLEYLGYRIEKPKTLEKGDSPYFLAFHKTYNNIYVYEGYTNFVGTVNFFV